MSPKHNMNLVSIIILATTAMPLFGGGFTTAIPSFGFGTTAMPSFNLGNYYHFFNGKVIKFYF